MSSEFGLDHPVCTVDGCESEVIGLDDGWEMPRGIVCQECIDYQDEHGHWPDESAKGCRPCHRDDGGIVHECDETPIDAVFLQPGDICDYCEVTV